MVCFPYLCHYWPLTLLHLIVESVDAIKERIAVALFVFIDQLFSSQGACPYRVLSRPLVHHSSLCHYWPLTLTHLIRSPLDVLEEG